MIDKQLNQKNIANETARKRITDRLEIGDKRGVSIPKMPAWKINALNQVGEDTLRQVLDKLENQNRAMVVRPTGFGKSFMLAGLTSSKNNDGTPKFKRCLYIYPTKVIKADMLDTYGVSGDDNRANMLQNTTFITYHMIGELVKAAKLNVNKEELSKDYIDEMNISDDTDDTDNESITNKRITIRKLKAENEIYDTSDTNWYSNLIKSKLSSIESSEKELYASIEEIKLRLKENNYELDTLKSKKSKAVKKMKTLNDNIENDSIILKEYNNNIKKIRNNKDKLNSIKNNSEDSETYIEISSKDDLINWLCTFDLILVDEAHRTGSSSFVALWQGVLKDLVINKGIKMVGATATPYRLDGLSLEQYIFGSDSRLKSIDINDCIKPGNYEYLGIDIDKIMNDPNVIDEGTTIDYLMSRGLFKKIDYAYAIHNKETFTKDVIDFLNKRRQSGNAITEENKDKLLKAINTKIANEILERRELSKLSTEERRVVSNTNTKMACEIKDALNKDMDNKTKEYILDKCEQFKNEDTKNIFIRKVNYKITTEEMQYILERARNINNLDIKLSQIVSREENYLQNNEISYINNKINDIPNIPELLRSIISDRNTYNLNYMKFIIFFANSAELNAYIARDRQSRTLIGSWFKQAFPDYTIFEASLHTGKGTQGVGKIKAEELSKFKPTDKMIDLIYCVDQLNMGYHVENITGVILLRNTDSASVYNQQIGRCCSVRAENNTVMIDIVDKKPIDDILNTSGINQEFGLDKDGKQKDLKYLLDPNCINICDLNNNIIKVLNNMRNMKFTEVETIRFLYSERNADIKDIVHMTGFSKSLIKETVKQILIENKQLQSIRNNETIVY